MAQGDSSRRRGGWIPGMAGAPAFTLATPDSAPIPILIAAPHGGRSYPATVLGKMRKPAQSTLRLEDRYADLLAQEVARATGAGLLIAHAPRAMIDLNRAVEDMDWSMIRRSALSLARPAPQGGRRARSGLGLVPRRLSGVGEIWSRLLEQRELEGRIEGIHRPYHETLAAHLRDLRSEWGAALLLDLHSMPPLGLRADGDQAAEFVVGDRFGAACEHALSGAAIAQLGAEGRLVAHNRPYAGGYVLDRHAAPVRGIHAMQLEVCRSAYLDSHLAEIGSGFDATVAVIVRLVQRLAGEVAALGRGGITAQAAE